MLFPDNIIIPRLNRIHRAPSSFSPSVQDKSVNHRCPYIPVPQELLNSSYVLPVFKKRMKPGFPYHRKAMYIVSFIVRAIDVANHIEMELYTHSIGQDLY